MSMFYVNFKTFLIVLTILLFTMCQTNVGCDRMDKWHLIQGFNIVDSPSKGKDFWFPLLTFFHFLNFSKWDKEGILQEMAIIRYKSFIKFTKLGKGLRSVCLVQEIIIYVNPLLSGTQAQIKVFWLNITDIHFNLREKICVMLYVI